MAKEILMYSGVADPTKAKSGQPEEVVDKAMEALLGALLRGRQVRVSIFVLKPEEEKSTIMEEGTKVVTSGIKAN